MTEVVQNHIETLTDAEIHDIFRRDYLRRLIRYKKTVELLQQKYGMPYKEFVAKNIVAEKDFSWDVESDSQDWEMALDGIRTMERKLREIDGKT